MCACVCVCVLSVVSAGHAVLELACDCHCVYLLLFKLYCLSLNAIFSVSCTAFRALVHTRGCLSISLLFIIGTSFWSESVLTGMMIWVSSILMKFASLDCSWHVSECAPLLTLKVSFGILQSFAVWLSFGLWDKHGSHSLWFSDWLQLLVGPQEPLLAVVKRQKLAWFGHVTRHDSSPKTILQGTFEGGRCCA